MTLLWRKCLLKHELLQSCFSFELKCSVSVDSDRIFVQQKIGLVKQLFELLCIVQYVRKWIFHLRNKQPSTTFAVCFLALLFS